PSFISPQRQKIFPGGERREAVGTDGRWLRVRGRSAGAEGGLLTATLLCSRGSRSCLREHSSLPGEVFEGELIIARFDQVVIEVDPERIFGLRLEIAPGPDDVPVGVCDRGSIGANAEPFSSYSDRTNERAEWGDGEFVRRCG